MSRRALEPGQHGRIFHVVTAIGTHRVRTRLRLENGTTEMLSSTAATKELAERALQTAIDTRLRAAPGSGDLGLNDSSESELVGAVGSEVPLPDARRFRGVLSRWLGYLDRNRLFDEIVSRHVEPETPAVIESVHEEVVVRRRETPDGRCAVCGGTLAGYLAAAGHTKHPVDCVALRTFC